VFSAHGSLAVAAALSRPAKAAPFFKPVSQPDQVLCPFRLALQRESGPRIALPAHRLYYLVDTWPRSTTRGALLRRSPRCSVITQRARMQQRPSAETASVSACAASCFVARVRASREEKNACPIPAESHVAVCMPGGEQRGHLAAPGRQMKWEDVAKGLSHLIFARSVTGHGRAAQTLGAQDCIA
jgi:hypothetical protein